MDIRKFKNNAQDDDDETWAEWLGDIPSDKKPAPKFPSLQEQAERARSRAAIDNFTVPHTSSTPNKSARSSLKQNEPQAISIQIHMPDLHLPKLRIPWRVFRPWLIVLLATILLLVGGKMFVSRDTSKQPSIDTTPASLQATIELGYKPLVPSPRPSTSKQPTKPTYSAARKLYTYLDTYKGANLTVDQQALPESIKKNPDDVKSIASSIQATDSFTTTVGEAYLYTDKTSGAQRIVLSNDKMLMFIQSTKKIEVASWVEYIQDLQ